MHGWLAGSYSLGSLAVDLCSRRKEVVMYRYLWLPFAAVLVLGIATPRQSEAREDELEVALDYARDYARDHFDAKVTGANKVKLTEERADGKWVTYKAAIAVETRKSVNDAPYCERHIIVVDFKVKRNSLMPDRAKRLAAMVGETERISCP